jgi:hypothetical protein
MPESLLEVMLSRSLEALGIELGRVTEGSLLNKLFYHWVREYVPYATTSMFQIRMCFYLFATHAYVLLEAENKFIRDRHAQDQDKTKLV